MLVRIISGLIAASVLIGLILLPPYVLAITALAASFIGLYEFAKAVKNKGITVDLGASYVASVIIIGKAYGATLPVHLFPGLSDALGRIFATEYLNTLLYFIIKRRNLRTEPSYLFFNSLNIAVRYKRNDFYIEILTYIKGLDAYGACRTQDGKPFYHASKQPFLQE